MKIIRQNTVFFISFRVKEFFFLFISFQFFFLLAEEDSDGCDIEENDDEAFEDILMENEILKKEIKELKASALAKEMQIRKEMSDMYSDIMKKIETDWK